MNHDRRATLNFAVSQLRDLRMMTGIAAPKLAPNIAKSLRTVPGLPKITGDELLAAYEQDRERRRVRRIARETGVPAPEKAPAITLRTPANVARLNTLLRAMGETVRVARHHDACSLYFYDIDGAPDDAVGWYTSSVCVPRACALTYGGWLQCLADRRCSPDNYKPAPRSASDEYERLVLAALATNRIAA